MNTENVVIIGSGCAGWTAAIYAARANLNPLVVTGAQAGGLLTTTTVVENFPGFAKGIDGNELMLTLQEQAKRFGARVQYLSTVEKVDFSKAPFHLTIDGELVQTKTVIVSTGAGHRHLNVPGEKELENRGVTFCATCDGALPVFRNKPVAVIGGGDSACEEASYLTRFASEVYLIHRRDHLRASKIMADRALSNPKIKPIWNSVVEEVLDRENGFVTGLRLRDTVSGKQEVISCNGVFVAIGHVPNTQLFQNQLDLDEAGYLRLRDGTNTNIPGVFGAGDCADRVYRQAITAAGMGCMAAMDAERFLSSMNN
jgi:thioredoxin reductase (NADPH)